MPPTIRSKMRLTAVVAQQWGGVKAIFNCDYDTATEEDRRFSKATPTGLAEYVIDNPAAVAQLVVGAAYYFDMIPVPEPERVPSQIPPPPPGASRA